MKKPKMKRFRILLEILARRAPVAGLFLLLVPFALSASVVNTSGDIVSASGGFVTGGTTRISSTGMGTFAAGTTVAGSAVCLADGSSCSTGAGWLNTSNQVFLANNATNLTAGYSSSLPVLFVDTTNARVGVRTSAPTATLDVVGSGSTIALRALGGQGSGSGAPGGGINLTAGQGSTGAGPTEAGSGGLVILAAGNGGDAGSNAAGAGGNVSITAGDGGTGTGADANGGNIYLTPGIAQSAGATRNGSVIVTRGSLIVGVTPEKTDDTSFYRLNVLGQSNFSGNVTITSGGLSIGSVPAYRILTTGTATHYVNAGSAHGVYFGHNMYGNVSGESGIYIGPQFQLPGNVGVLVGASISPGMQLNIYNITRVETVRISPFLADTYNGTVSLLDGILLVAPNVSNGTVTAYQGINQQDVTSATGNTRGIRSQITAGSGKHNLYMNGTANNYFAGNVSIGAATPSAELDVNGAEAAADGLLAAIEITNTASGGGTWYLRAGATGTNTPAGGFSIANTAYRLSITSGGLVGINTTAPVNTLNVVGNVNITDVLYIRESEIRQGFSYVNYTAGAVSTSSASAYTRLNMSLLLAANSRYTIDCDLISDAAAATTGVVIGINLTGSPTSVRATYTSPGATVAGAITVETFSGTSTTTNLFADTASTTTPYIAKIDGVVVTSSNAVTWNVDVRSEVGSSAVNVREGSFCRASRVG